MDPRTLAGILRGSPARTRKPLRVTRGALELLVAGTVDIKEWLMIERRKINLPMLQKTPARAYRKCDDFHPCADRKLRRKYIFPSNSKSRFAFRGANSANSVRFPRSLKIIGLTAMPVEIHMLQGLEQLINCRIESTLRTLAT